MKESLANLLDRTDYPFLGSEEYRGVMAKCAAAHQASLVLGNPPELRPGGLWNRRMVATAVIFLAVMVTTIALGLWVGTAGALTLERHIQKIDSELATDS